MFPAISLSIRLDGLKMESGGVNFKRRLFSWPPARRRYAATTGNISTIGGAPITTRGSGGSIRREASGGRHSIDAGRRHVSGPARRGATRRGGRARSRVDELLHEMAE